ncbi:putative RNA-directed DNA polymerase from transposon X-element [Exaiptasia diaphana]|nr:putative RNA-directed DNA polymerase from transposon X-element [Exaiptasia diaphana]
MKDNNKHLDTSAAFTSCTVYAMHCRICLGQNMADFFCFLLKLIPQCIENQVVRRKAERKFLATGLEVHRLLYNEACNVYNEALKSAKHEFYRAQISDSQQNQLFQLIDCLIKVKTAPPLPSHESTQVLADRFIEFFTNKIRDLKVCLRSSTLAKKELSVPSCTPKCLTSFSEFSVVSNEYIYKLVLNSKPKSCKLDPVPTYLIKEVIDVLSSTLTSLINTSLSSGVFPTLLKKGLIHPSIKKHSLDCEVYSNFRHISNVAFLSKTVERVAATQDLNYLESNGLMAKFQSAYRCFHSTALLRVFNDMLTAIDQQQEVVLVLLDLSSAFDTIDHEALISRLQCRYGISGTALKWFRSYLIGRSQQVAIKDSLSQEKNLQFGVPQGSVLGPLLFSLFFAPLEDVILAHGLSVMTYADDTVVFVRWFY